MSIGDTHGREVVSKIYPIIDNFDYVVFVGDYFDSFDLSDVNIIMSFKEILKLKKEYPKKVILLLGNHDIQYWFYTKNYVKFQCSGFRPSMAGNIQSLLKEDKKIFQVAFQLNNYLWSHAGISNASYNIHWKKYNIPKEHLAEELNKYFILEFPELFHIAKDRGGIHPVGGIFWIDRKNTYDDPLNGFHQIVGHSQTKEIVSFNKNEETSITFIDCPNKFYITGV